MKAIKENKKHKVNFKVKGSASTIRNQLMDKKKQPATDSGYGGRGGRSCC